MGSQYTIEGRSADAPTHIMIPSGSVRVRVDLKGKETPEQAYHRWEREAKERLKDADKRAAKAKEDWRRTHKSDPLMKFPRPHKDPVVGPSIQEAEQAGA